MKLTPFQLAMLAVGGFATVVMLNVLSKYQSSEEFREGLKNMTPADILSIRTRRVAEENMQQPVAAIVNDDEDEDGDES